MEEDLELLQGALRDVMALGKTFRRLESRWEYDPLENDARSAKETLQSLSRSINVMMGEVIRKVGNA